MGNSIPVLIRTDATDQIRDHADEFVNDLFAVASGLTYRNEVVAGNHGNVAQILPARHDTIPRLLLMHEGLMTELGWAEINDRVARGQADLIRERIRLARRLLAEAERALEIAGQAT